MSASPRKSCFPTSIACPPEARYRSGVTTGSRVRITRNGPKARTSNADAGRGDLSGICSERTIVRRLAGVEDPDAVAEGPLEVEEVVQGEVGVRARQRHEREVVVALPGLDEERVVAEEDVVRVGRGGEVCGSIAAGLLAYRRLPVEELGRLVPRPGDLRDDERGERGRCPRRGRAARSRLRPAARRKEAGRSGAASRASRSCARSRGRRVGRADAHAVSIRVSRGSTASPAAAATSTAGRTGNPAVKSPAACQT